MLSDTSNPRNLALSPLEIQTTIIAAEGVHCHECAERIVAVLRSMDGVVHATAELARERLTVRYDPRRMDVPTLYERIELSGYRPCAADVGPDDE